jgi:hypothetical protein
MANNIIERVSVASDGTQANGSSTDTDISVSGDGRYVSFRSFASNLLGAGVDTNGRSDVFVYDRHTGAIERVSIAYCFARQPVQLPTDKNFGLRSYVRNMSP